MIAVNRAAISRARAKALGIRKWSQKSQSAAPEILQKVFIEFTALPTWQPPSSVKPLELHNS